MTTFPKIWEAEKFQFFYYCVPKCITVWTFLDFSITQILREINFRDSRTAKSAFFAILEALNLDFYEFLHFLKSEIYQLSQIKSP